MEKLTFTNIMWANNNMYGGDNARQWRKWHSQTSCEQIIICKLWVWSKVGLGTLFINHESHAKQWWEFGDLWKLVWMRGRYPKHASCFRSKALPSLTFEILLVTLRWRIRGTIMLFYLFWTLSTLGVTNGTPTKLCCISFSLSSLSICA